MNLRKAAEMALEALENLQGGCTDSDDGTVEAITVWCPEIIDALKEALDQPEQEPVAWVFSDCQPDYRGWITARSKKSGDYNTPLYRHPAPIPKDWQLVPIEPTSEMLAAADNAPTPRLTYKAMLAAAPKPEDV